MLLFVPEGLEIPTIQKVPLDGQSVTNTASRHLPSRSPRPPPPQQRGAASHLCTQRFCASQPASPPTRCLAVHREEHPPHPAPAHPIRSWEFGFSHFP